MSTSNSRAATVQFSWVRVRLGLAMVGVLPVFDSVSYSGERCPVASLKNPSLVFNAFLRACAMEILAAQTSAANITTMRLIEIKKARTAPFAEFRAPEAGTMSSSVVPLPGQVCLSIS